MSKILGFTLLFLAILLSVTTSTPASEPVRLGRSLTQWQRQLQGGTTPQRLQAVVALRQFGTISYDELATALLDKNASVRYWAAVGLTRRGEDNRIEPGHHKKYTTALSAALSDPDTAVRIQAAGALATWNNNNPAIETLVEGLSDRRDGVRILAASVLENLKDRARSAAPALLKARGDSNKYVVRIATRVLSRWDLADQPK